MYAAGSREPANPKKDGEMKTNGEPIFCSNVGRDGKTCGANLTQNPRAVILKVVRSYYGSIQNVNGEPRGKKADD